ncbi:GntR family transcriptional regulator [Henriciella sp. AS95]|uniref:GntR family transcriptional regulator n=1 Tax=Henriciella sp. AS95 TaxID=3135782 RepID=UPI0031817957
MNANKPPPRYQQLAELIRSEILSGRLKPGDHIPTEMEICEQQKVSRHTAREALRLLTAEGLLKRRKGSGSVVQAPQTPVFAQALGDFEAILQYARDAALVLQNTRRATKRDLQPFELSDDYVRFEGLRGLSGQEPLALTRIFALASISPDETTLTQLGTSLSEWIEQEHGVTVAKVTQRMEAIAVGAADSEQLNVKEGSPALRTLRRYRDQQGRIILLSESLHPAGRFAYEMELKRQH